MRLGRAAEGEEDSSAAGAGAEADENSTLEV